MQYSFKYNRIARYMHFKEKRNKTEVGANIVGIYEIRNRKGCIRLVLLQLVHSFPYPYRVAYPY